MKRSVACLKLWVLCGVGDVQHGLEDLAAALLEHEILDDLEIDQILEGRKLNKPLSTGDRVDAVSAANAVAVSPASIIDEGTEPRE